MSELKKKTTISFLSCFSVLFFISFHSFSQKTPDRFSVMFYNVENLFDPQDDDLSADDEFTPDGERHWTYKRLNSKLINLSKVILSASGWEPPGVVALCEVENQSVLQKLTGKTPLQSFPYQIIHKESPDHRGIDVALLYNSNQFYPLEYKYYPLKLKNDSVVATREILYVSGVAIGADTLHFFINHWPSRYSGLLESRSIRGAAARLLRQKVDELFEKFAAPKIIILGDFNDQPGDESIVKYLNAKEVKEQIIPEVLYNLSFNWGKGETGTHKYQSQWSVFDQIIVSGELLVDKKGLFTTIGNAQILDKPFLLEKDERYGGIKPNRTYLGYRYHGGFSDHLPVLLELDVSN